VPLLYGLTLLVGAALLFAVQPMTGRLLLPLLGGSPAVWNTCLVFFQGVLLLGYLYSHLATTRFGLRGHAVFHVVLVAAVLLALPIAVRASDPPTEYPALWLLAALTTSVGLPFFVLSTTSPLLQRWYASTQARGAADPYFLSVASNFGSLVALLAYPVLIEPTLTRDDQADWWHWGYVIYVGLVAACAVFVSQGERSRVSGPMLREDGSLETAPGALTPSASGPLRGSARLRWLILSFVPSSLLVGVTNAITTDVAPIPLLWVVPLALYLITFIIAFAPRARLPLQTFGKVLAVCAIALTLTLLAGATEPLGLVLGIHLVTFFVAALVCHGRLAAERPAADQLTSFYLWMSVGGVLGGAFNALLAPMLFHRLGFVEYPLALVAACFLRPTAGRLRLRATDFLAPLLLGACVAALVLAARLPAPRAWAASLAETTGLPADMVRSAVVFGLPLIVAYVFVERPVRFALGLGALFVAGSLDDGAQGKVLYVERGFLGVVKVTSSPDGAFTQMVHGNTIHGKQRVEPRAKYVAAFVQPLGSANPLAAACAVTTADTRWDDRRRPLTYYHPTGPAGTAFRFLVDGWTGPRRIGAVGLGTGALASYARPDQAWTFFELDPAVERLARDDRYFTYLRDAKAQSLDVVIGDARRRLAEEPDGAFDLLVLDAFSSDAIPVHLLTAEAFELYERKLATDGVILMHLSNRYLDLPPVVAKIAETASPPLVVRRNDDLGLSDKDTEDGKSPSIWVIVARRDEDFGPLTKPLRGFMRMGGSSAPRWTDDRADVLGAFRKNEE
jgi:hypothetical protein